MTVLKLLFCHPSTLIPSPSPSHRPLICFLTSSSSNHILPSPLYKFHNAIKSCPPIPSLVRTLHARLILFGLSSSIFFQNHIIHMYFRSHLPHYASLVFSLINSPNVFTWNMMINGLSNCGRIHDAAHLFDKMPHRDVVSWNTMMSAYFNYGKPRDTIRIFSYLLRAGSVSPCLPTFQCVFKACASIGSLSLALQFHGLVEKHGFSNATSIDASLIDMYIKCGAVGYSEQIFNTMSNPSLFCCNSMMYGYSILYGIENALDLFYRMPNHDDVSWNTIISLLCQHGYGAQSLNMFVEMWHQGFMPNSMTYASVIGICTRFYDLYWGRHLHARILRLGVDLDGYTGSALIDMYAKGGCMDSARRIFDRLTECHVISWTSLIAGYVQFGFKKEALEVFSQMRRAPMVPPDAFVVATVLGACRAYEDSTVGVQLHVYAIKTAFDSSIPVGNALIKMYTKVGSTQDAEIAFNVMPIKDVISWTTMINAVSQSSNIKKARQFFDKMPERNVVSWNSMMAVYVQHGYWEEGLKLLSLMERHGIKLDSNTFATLISACADYVLLELGKQVMAQVEKFGFALYALVASCAVTMYSKCGQILEAEKVFNSIPLKTVIAWNSMMAGYAQNGQGMKVVELFETMLMLNYTPDSISYVSLLMGCSHAGLVEKGCHYFINMNHIHKICPAREHYACMVDLLSRAGLLEEALVVIAEMPFEASSDVWGALLAACRTYSNKTHLVEFAAKQLLLLEDKGSGSWSLLANMYSDSGKLEHAASARRMMREKEIPKIAGCSWIEVYNRVHVFTADCTNHPQIVDVLKMLENLWKMEDKDGKENVKNSLYSGGDELHLVT